LDDLGHLPGVRNVCWHTDDLVPLTSERCGCICEFCYLAIGDDEPCASPCERLGYGTPNTLRRSGHERDLTCYAEPLQAHETSCALPSDACVPERYDTGPLGAIAILIAVLPSRR